MPSIALFYFSFWFRAGCLYSQMLILFLIAVNVYSFRQSENALTPMMNRIVARSLERSAFIQCYHLTACSAIG